MTFFLASNFISLEPAPWSLIPFALLLLTIALAPLLNKEWWEHYYKTVSIVLGTIPLAYYLFALHAPDRVLHAAMEYGSFVILIGSLFIIAGGIHLRVDRGGSKPWANTLFLAGGSILANMIGTTGASMLLIRPWLRLNEGRVAPFHVVFFIFTISNLGGCLTPIGDPPLFLGYLKNIPFFWPLDHLMEEWALALGLILGLFFLFDSLNTKKKHAPLPHPPAERSWKLTGSWNLFFLAAVLAGIFLPSPWREVEMTAAALASFFTTSKSVHAANDFDFHPIAEVAWLFAGIFATMIPALDFIQSHATAFHIDTPGKFYWITGGLSELLDNAPTYLTFLTACLALHGRSIDVPADMAAQLAENGIFIAAISVSAVFFGAMTYIGNGPNFMVKAIAEKAGVPTPGFFGYLFRYAVPILLPVLALVYWIFFRGP